MTHSRLLRILALPLSFALVLAACPADETDVTPDPPDSDGAPDDSDEPPDGDPEAWDAGAPPEWEQILQAGRSEGRVVVGGPAFLAEPMMEAFERDTGIQLDWVGASGAELSARMQEEVAAGAVTMDLKFGGPQELFVDYPSILEPIRPQLILPTSLDETKWRRGEVPFSDPEGTYMLRGSEWVFGWVLVNSDMIDPESIQVWDDLLKEEFRGQMVSGDISAPSPGQGFMQHLYNVKGPDFVDRLVREQDIAFFVDNVQVVEQVARGVRPVALGSIQSVVERFRGEGFDNLVAVLPQDHPGYLTGGFSILVEAQGAPHPNAAQVFINWFASPPGLAVWERVMLEAAGRTDVNEPAVPDYVRPVDGVDYWEDWDLDWLLNERANVAEWMADLQRDVGG